MNKQTKDIKNYNAWLHWNILSECNMCCEYCLSSSCRQNAIKKGKAKREAIRKDFGIFIVVKKIRKALFMSIPSVVRALKFRMYGGRGKIRPIDIPALMRALAKTKKTFKISFTGGEPFLIPNFVNAMQELSKKHYIHVITNLVTGDIKGFAERINPERVLSIHASLHIKELERLRIVDKFIGNFLLCRRKGFNINAFEIAYPPLLSEVEKYRFFFRKKGIDIYFSPFIGVYNGRCYPASYTAWEREVFGITKSDVIPYHQKGKICNAGYNVGVVSPTGDISVCSQIGEKIGNIYEKIQFRSELTICPYDNCDCPLNFIDRYLFEKALEDKKVSFRRL